MSTIKSNIGPALFESNITFEKNIFKFQPFLFKEIKGSILVLLPLMRTSILPFRIRRATSVPLGKGTKFILHHGKMSMTKRRAIQILHISMFQFTFKCGYNNFTSKYTDINSL